MRCKLTNDGRSMMELHGGPHTVSAITPIQDGVVNITVIIEDRNSDVRREVRALVNGVKLSLASSQAFS